jgi:hypothetical protein
MAAMGVPASFPRAALIAAGNVAGGSEPYVFGVFSSSSSWIGIAHPRWTSTGWRSPP